jgi:glycosyltransferase involved in cell wall biosynthesis
VPNIFKPPETAPPGPQGRKDILFLGGFWHKPNGDGVTWFVNEIWPKIRSREPEVQFIIAGSSIDADIKALEQSPGVKVVGYIEDLKALFDSCRVFVVPLRFGAGMKGKVGQSLNYGLPLVSTSIGAEGIPIEPEEDFLLANNANEFAASVIRLLRDDELWRKFQRHGQDIMAADFSPVTISSQIASLFNV